MCRFVIRLLRPDLARSERDRWMVYAAYGAIVIAVLCAQVAMYQNERALEIGG